MQTTHASPVSSRSPRSPRSFRATDPVGIGQVIAERYRIERDSVRTEAGVVYEATDLKAGRRVALEVASSIVEPRARRKWTRDAMLAQRLEGEHVLRVLDVGALPDGVPFVVREPVLSTLGAELAARGPIPVAQAVAWTLEACEAVAEAHALGLAHGDIRLANVFLARGPRGSEPWVKLAWTSAAKAERAAQEDMTRDVAGLGALLRVLATGSLDEEAEGSPTLPTDIAHAIARALSRAPEGAFANVAELARMLAPFAPPGHTSARTVAFLLCRAGIGVSGEVPESRRSLPSRTSGPTSVRKVDVDAWFASEPPASRPRLAVDLEPAPHHPRAFTAVALALLAAVLGGTVFLWSTGRLPRWTGAAPPDDAETTTVTAAPTPVTEPAAPMATVPAPAEPATVPVESLPPAPPTTQAAQAAVPAPASPPAAATTSSPARASLSRESSMPSSASKAKTSPKPERTEDTSRADDTTESSSAPEPKEETVPTPGPEAPGDPNGVGF